MTGQGTRVWVELAGAPSPLHPPWRPKVFPSLELLSPAGGCEPALPRAWGAGPSAPAGTISPKSTSPRLLQVNMVIGILVFNKLVSKDGITDKKLKERAG